MNNPKADTAFPQAYGTIATPGLSQYAYVAAEFHSALLAGRADGSNALRDAHLVARYACDHADAFFAELAKRTQS